VAADGCAPRHGRRSSERGGPRAQFANSGWERCNCLRGQVAMVEGDCCASGCGAQGWRICGQQNQDQAIAELLRRWLTRLAARLGQLRISKHQ
jgi:hypothetical protein